MSCDVRTVFWTKTTRQADYFSNFIQSGYSTCSKLPTDMGIPQTPTRVLVSSYAVGTNIISLCFPSMILGGYPKDTNAIFSLFSNHTQSSRSLLITLGPKSHLMALGGLNSGKLLDGLGDDVQTLLKLFLRDNQGRSETNDIAMGGLGQKALALEK